MLNWMCKYSVVAIIGLGVSVITSTSALASVTVSINQLPKDPQKRPTIGVVLAGGGAKGAAHVGVLKALEDMRIPVDYIAGTSMGAYVGGLYATGMSADEIETLFDSIDWNSGYRDRVDRSQRRVKDKEYDDRYQLQTDLGLRWGELRASKGVVQGQNMLRLLRDSSGNLPAFKSFDNLAIPYRSVATDIVHLKEVVLDKGYLVDAMMASMSVPGALPPYELNGQMLVDGGVTNNMPVDIAKAMGADIVIAVDISTDYKPQDSFTNFLAVADQLSNYLVRRSTQEQVENLTDNDVYLKPNVGWMETTQFDKMPEAFAEGYNTAFHSEPKLHRLSISSEQYKAYQQHKEAIRAKLDFGKTIFVNKVDIDNRSHYSDAVINSHLDIQPGRTFNTEELESRIQGLYALDRFELVTYQYEAQQDGTHDLDIMIREKSWGPNYLNFRFFLEDDFNTQSQYAIGTSANFTDLSETGAELRANLEMGTAKRLELELYTPFINNQQLFSMASFSYSNETRNVMESEGDYTELVPNSDYVGLNYKQWNGELSLGYQPTLWQEFSTGLRYSNGQIEFNNEPSVGRGDFERKGVFARYRIDTLDDFDLPTKGWYLDTEYLYSSDRTDFDGINNDNFSEVKFNLAKALTYTRHTLVGKLDYGMVMNADGTENDSNTIVIDPRTLGGFLNLSGVPRNSLIGDNKAFSSVIYRYRWFDNDFGLFQSPVYLGGSIEYGGVWSDSSLKNAPMHVAGSLFTGIDSPIGPIILAYGQTENNFRSIYLMLGTSYK